MVSLFLNLRPFATSTMDPVETRSTAGPTAKKQKKDADYGASSSSYYTTEEKKNSYDTLDDVLKLKCADPKIRQVLKDMLDVCSEITEALRTALVTVEGSTNDFGDSQLSVDVRWSRLDINKFYLFIRSGV
jgi:hypothetical protein